MNVTVANFALGGVNHVDIDGVDYPISDAGCTIEKVADIGITPVVGKPEPRVVERGSHYVVTVSMLENTLEMLRLAWNLPNTISYGGAHDFLYLGISDAPSAHTLTVRGWGGLDGDGVSRIWREWYFRKAISFEPGEQDLSVGNTVVIPVRFYCYADSTQTDGQEFGWVKQEKGELVVNGNMEVDANWTSLGSVVTNERSSTRVRSSTYSRHVATDLAGEGIYSEDFTTIANRQYRVSAWVYVVADGASGVRVAFKEGGGATHHTIDAIITTVGSWLRIVDTVTDATGGSAARMIIDQNGAGTTEFYIDDVSVREA